MTQPRFLGLNVCGPTRQNAAMSWLIQPANGDAPLSAPFPQAPAVLNTPIYQYVISPQDNQGSFNFGNGRKLRITISRLFSWQLATDHFFLTGRVFIVIPGTGEVIVLNAKTAVNANTVTGAYGNEAVFYQADNLMFDTWVPATSQIFVYFESDIDNVGAGINPILPEFTTVWLTMFNFNPDIV